MTEVGVGESWGVEKYRGLNVLGELDQRLLELRRRLVARSNDQHPQRLRHHGVTKHSATKAN